MVAPAIPGVEPDEGTPTCVDDRAGGRIHDAGVDEGHVARQPGGAVGRDASPVGRNEDGRDVCCDVVRSAESPAHGRSERLKRIGIEADLLPLGRLMCRGIERLPGRNRRHRVGQGFRPVHRVGHHHPRHGRRRQAAILETILD